MMKNIEYLKQTLKKNGKMRMLLMYAVNDNCSNAVDLSATDAYCKDLLSAAVEKNPSLGFNKEMKDKCAGIISNAISNVNLQGATKKDKLIDIEKSLKASMTEEVRSALSDIPESLDVKDINKLAVDTVDSVILWMMVRDVLADIPLCEDTLKAASSYRKQKDAKKVSEKKAKEETDKKSDSKEQKEEPAMSSDEIQKIVLSFCKPEKRKRAFSELSDKEKKIVEGTLNVLRAEAEQAAETLKKYINRFDDKEKDKAAVLAAASLKKYGKFPGALAFARELVDENIELDEESFLVSVLYSEYVLRVDDEIKKSDNKAATLYEYLKLPGFSSLACTSSVDDVDIKESLKEYNHLETMRTAAKEEEKKASKKATKQIEEKAVDSSAEIVEVSGDVVDSSEEQDGTKEDKKKRKAFKFSFNKVPKKKKLGKYEKYIEEDDSNDNALINCAEGKDISEMSRDERSALIRNELKKDIPSTAYMMLLDMDMPEREKKEA